MIRSLWILGLAVALAACRPVSGAAEEEAAPLGGDAVPASYDWHVLTHGGSADLDFGDGDWAEGVNLFHLSCLPDSRTVRASWNGEDEAVLTSGTATGTFRRDAEVPTDHPVFAALRQGASLAVGQDRSDLTLPTRPEGLARIESFFDYCTRPLPPPEAVPPPPAVVALPSEGDDQPDDAAGLQPVEPGVDVVQPEGSAQQPVDR